MSVERRDVGTSMIELIVGMALMAVFMTIFTAAITTMYRSANKAESLNTTSAQLNQAFTRMDGTVRYASAISTPGRGADGNWYVEMLTTNTGARVCTQLRVNTATQQLQQRSWTAPRAGNAPVPPFVPVANNVSNGSAGPGVGSQPFVLTPASNELPSAQLTMRLEASVGSGNSGTSSLSVTTFTAVNSSLDSQTVGVCSDLARS